MLVILLCAVRSPVTTRTLALQTLLGGQHVIEKKKCFLKARKFKLSQFSSGNEETCTVRDAIGGKDNSLTTMSKWLDLCSPCTFGQLRDTF